MKFKNRMLLHGDRNKRKLGIVEECITGRDGIVRAVKLRAGKGHLERAIQQLYPLELSCDRRVDRQVPGAALNPQAGVFKPRRDAAVAAGIRVHDVTQQEQEV